MTKDEAIKLAKIIEQVDGGCWHCVTEAAEACTAAFPQWVWTVGKNGVVNVERSANLPPPPPEPPKDWILKDGNFSPDTTTDLNEGRHQSPEQILNALNCPMPFLARWLLKMKN